MTNEPWTWNNATVVRVIDGDTLIAKLSMDIGFHGSVTFEQHLRLLGINAPSIKTKKGQEAAELVKDETFNQNLTITTHKPYKYGDEWMA